MQVLRHAGPCSTVSPVLVVMLPGAYSAPADFEREGFVEAVRSRALAVDIWLAGAHLGYVFDGSVLRRLHADVIEPARKQGYRRIWLVGISLGGFVGLGYAARHGRNLEGIVAIAPYPGRRPLIKAIVDAGGPAVWRHEALPRDPSDVDHEIWQWLAALPADAPALYLAYGQDDRLVAGQRLMATLLPAERTTALPGGHDWPAWRALWHAWLDRGLLPAAAGPVRGR